MSNKASTTTPFLDQLDAATKVDDVGVYIIEDFLSQEEAKESFEILNNSTNLPWKANPTLYRIKLNQHAYEFRRSKRNIKRASKSIGMSKLEELSRKIEKEFDGKVSYVWCNRLHPEHNVPYHTDTFGQHIVVLSLGSQRTINFRHLKSKEIIEVRPNPGSLYFMPLKVNDEFEHCVCSAKEEDLMDGEETRLSFLFFIQPPKYATEFKITVRDKLRGVLEDIYTFIG